MDSDIPEMLRLIKYKVYPCVSPDCPNEGTTRVDPELLGDAPCFFCSDHLKEAAKHPKELCRRMQQSEGREAFMELAVEETTRMADTVARAMRFSFNWRKVYATPKDVAEFAELFCEELVESEVYYCSGLRFRGSDGFTEATR